MICFTSAMLLVSTPAGAGRAVPPQNIVKVDQLGACVRHRPVVQRSITDFVRLITAPENTELADNCWLSGHS
jgi:hypothetical protein